MYVLVLFCTYPAMNTGAGVAAITEKIALIASETLKSSY